MAALEEFFVSRPNWKVIPSTPRLSFWMTDRASRTRHALPFTKPQVYHALFV